MQGKSGRFDTIEIDGQRVRGLRKERHLTQADLAALVTGVSRGYLSIIESNSPARVSRAVADRLAAALGTDAADLAMPAPPSVPPSPARGLNASKGRTRGAARLRALAPPGAVGQADTLTSIRRRLETLRQQLDELVDMVDQLLHSAGRPR